MSDLIKEETTVQGLVDGLLVIQRECVWADGARLGGDFRFDPRSKAWLAEQLEAAADDSISRITHDAPPDHFTVYTRGGDRGQPININVHNKREGARTYTIGGMSPEVARKLAADLRSAHA
jgi:hypothetical protein